MHPPTIFLGSREDETQALYRYHLIVINIVIVAAMYNSRGRRGGKCGSQRNRAAKARREAARAEKAETVMPTPRVELELKIVNNSYKTSSSSSTEKKSSSSPSSLLRMDDSSEHPQGEERLEQDAQIVRIPAESAIRGSVAQELRFAQEIPAALTPKGSVSEEHPWFAAKKRPYMATVNYGRKTPKHLKYALEDKPRA